MARKLNTLSFTMSPRDSQRDVRFFQLRDVPAILEIITSMNKHGYEFGEGLVNHPPGPNARSRQEIAHVDLSHMELGDMILTNTRIPKSDEHHADPKQVPRGYTDLELVLFDAWNAYLTRIARSHVQLAEPMYDHLLPEYEWHRRIKFRSRGPGAFYKEIYGHKRGTLRQCPEEPRTAAFLLRLEELFPGGPGYIGAFGMDGVSNFIWSWLLRHRYSDWLLDPGFTMVELSGPPLPERPTDYRWIEEWDAQPALMYRPKPEPRRVRRSRKASAA